MYSIIRNEHIIQQVKFYLKWTCRNSNNPMSVNGGKDSSDTNPDRALLKEALGGQNNYREGEGKCCGRVLKAAD